MGAVPPSPASSGSSGGTMPGLTFHFYVEIDGLVEGTFLECSGISAERQVEEYAEGGVNDRVHVLPGRTKHGRITLKRGMISAKLWQWYEKGLEDCVVERKNISVLLYNPARSVIKRWNFINAYPVKWEGPALNTSSNEVAVESIEVAFDEIL